MIKTIQGLNKSLAQAQKVRDDDTADESAR